MEKVKPGHISGNIPHLTFLPAVGDHYYTLFSRTGHVDKRSVLQIHVKFKCLFYQSFVVLLFFSPILSSAMLRFTYHVNAAHVTRDPATAIGARRTFVIIVINTIRATSVNDCYTWVHRFWLGRVRGKNQRPSFRLTMFRGKGEYKEWTRL